MSDDEVGQFRHRGLGDLGARSFGRELGPRLLARRVDLGREHVVDHDVAEYALAEHAGGAQHPAHVGGVDALEVAPENLLERNVEVRLDHERVQHGLAELPVADPRPTVPDRLERADVDEHRRRTAELDVERVAVLGRETLFESSRKDLEMQQRC